MTLLTWNTEYYWPKVGDYNALLRADGTATQAACDSHVINIFLQEDAVGYLHPDTCQGAADDPAAPFTIFRAELVQALSRCPAPVAWAVKCSEMHGLFGTKAELGHARVNQQVAVSFYRKDGPFDIVVSTKSVSHTEKGGVMVQVTAKDGGAQAVAIGVHLDAAEESVRNLQICKIVKRALKETATLEGPVFEGGAHCQSEFKKREAAARLQALVKTHLPLGLYWLGDSNYRLPMSAFGVDPEDEGDCERSKGGMLKSGGKLKSCVGAKERVVQRLADVGCGVPGAVAALQAGDELSLAESLLTSGMGATVNQPYPAFLPSYPFTTMQPHGVSVPDDPADDLVVNHKAAALVEAWGTPIGCGPAGRYGGGAGGNSVLVQALKQGIEFTAHEALRVKGHGSAQALNLGYLDRLFVVADPATTTVERELEVQAVLYGGDHLPQLFKITATYDKESPPPALRGDAGFFVGSPLRKSDTQIQTTTPKCVAGARPDAEFSPHRNFGASNEANTERITQVTHNLAGAGGAGAGGEPGEETQPRFRTGGVQLRAQE
jgi:hypothetical protein